MTSINHYIEHWVLCMLRLWIVLVMGVLKLLLLHLLLLLELLLEHLLLLVLAEPIELVVLHSLLLLDRHRRLLVRIGKEVILFDIGLIDFWCRTIQQLALICFHHCWRLVLSMALMGAIDSIVLQAIEILLRDWHWIFYEVFSLRWILKKLKWINGCLFHGD